MQKYFKVKFKKKEKIMALKVTKVISTFTGVVIFLLHFVTV